MVRKYLENQFRQGLIRNVLRLPELPHTLDLAGKASIECCDDRVPGHAKYKTDVWVALFLRVHRNAWMRSHVAMRSQSQHDLFCNSSLTIVELCALQYSPPRHPYGRLLRLSEPKSLDRCRILDALLQAPRERADFKLVFATARDEKKQSKEQEFQNTFLSV